MFIVFNKQKIYSYLISVSTVVVLFVIAFTVTTNESLITSSQVEEQETYNKISITVKEDWNEEKIENVLQTLESSNTKANFYITKELANKFQKLIEKIKQYGHEITISLENNE